MNGIHVGIIMDGNGRWANARGWPRVAGHRQGARAVRRALEAAPDLGIGMLTLYAFSSDNWRRPATEVRALMQLFSEYLAREVAECVKSGVRLQVIGRRDRLAKSLVKAMDAAERATSECTRITMRLAVDYSGRDAIVNAASLAAFRLASEALAENRVLPLTAAEFEAELAAAMGVESAPPLDLLIRTGGEQRISDFLLWEAAYAELVFTPRMWPDFDGSDLASAVEEFRRRDRRFGGVKEIAPAALAASTAREDAGSGR